MQIYLHSYTAVLFVFQLSFDEMTNRHFFLSIWRYSCGSWRDLFNAQSLYPYLKNYRLRNISYTYILPSLRARSDRPTSTANTVEITVNVVSSSWPENNFWTMDFFCRLLGSILLAGRFESTLKGVLKQKEKSHFIVSYLDTTSLNFRPGFDKKQ